MAIDGELYYLTPSSCCAERLASFRFSVISGMRSPSSSING